MSDPLISRRERKASRKPLLKVRKETPPRQAVVRMQKEVSLFIRTGTVVSGMESFLLVGKLQEIGISLLFLMMSLCYMLYSPANFGKIVGAF